MLIPLPWTRPPISQNDRRAHFAKARIVAKVLGEARAAIRAAHVAPVGSAQIVLHYRVPDRRRRDADNLAVVLKIVQDALVDEGVIPRDDWECVPASGQRIHPPDGGAGEMWVELVEVVEAAL